MAYVIERPVKSDLEPVWAGTAKGASHAILVPSDVAYAYKRLMAKAANKTREVSEARRAEAYALIPATGGEIKTACRRTLKVSSLGTSLKPCKVCTAQFAKEPKKGRALSERQVESVATGVVDGAPREAEARREAEVRAISGDAAKSNATIADTARQGNREGARELARELDLRGPSAPVPSGPSATQRRGVSVPRAGVSAGQRGEARTDGVAMHHGPDKGTQTLEQWQAVQTGRPGRTTLDAPKGRERVDKGALGQPLVPHSKDVAECAEMRCAHIVGDIPADRKEALTWREYAKLNRTRQRRHWECVKRVQAEIKRERAFAARQPVKIHAGNKSRGANPKIERLMGAPGRRDGLDWNERQATSVR